jgi:hypothetical protein
MEDDGDGVTGPFWLWPKDCTGDQFYQRPEGGDEEDAHSAVHTVDV